MKTTLVKVSCGQHHTYKLEGEGTIIGWVSVWTDCGRHCFFLCPHHLAPAVEISRASAARILRSHRKYIVSRTNYVEKEVVTNGTC